MQSTQPTLFSKFFRSKTSITIATGILLVLAGAIYFFYQQSPSRAIEKAAIEIIQLRLFDPDSAKFQNVAFKTGIGVCGEVNAKNQMGGYVGYKAFLVEEYGLVLLEGPDLPHHQKDVLRRCYS